MSLREQTFHVARLIGLEAAEKTYLELNHQDPPPFVPVTLHVLMVGAWAEAVELLRFEQESLGEVPK